jgi:hypothetical protein
LGLTKIETVLIYAGIPALVIVVVFGLVFTGQTRRGGGRRYRPGRPYEFRPVWFLANTGRTAGGELALTPAPSGEWPATAGQSGTGGASGTW